MSWSLQTETADNKYLSPVVLQLLGQKLVLMTDMWSYSIHVCGYESPTIEPSVRQTHMMHPELVLMS